MPEKVIELKNVDGKLVVAVVDFENRIFDLLPFDAVLTTFESVIGELEFEQEEFSLTMQIMLHLVKQSLGKSAVSNA